MCFCKSTVPKVPYYDIWAPTVSLSSVNSFEVGKGNLQLWHPDRLRLRIIYLNDTFDESLRLTVTPYSGSAHHAQTSPFEKTTFSTQGKSILLWKQAASSLTIIGMSLVWSSLYVHQLSTAKQGETPCRGSPKVTCPSRQHSRKQWYGTILSAYALSFLPSKHPACAPE